MLTGTRTTDEIARLGTDVYARVVKPQLLPEHDGKYVAVNVETGEFEIDADDYTAVMRLRAKCPNADVWLERAGYDTAYKFAGFR
jgi:hypothetical protein